MLSVCCAFRGTKEKSHHTSVIAYFPVYLKIHVHTDLVEMMTDHWELAIGVHYGG